VKGDTMIEEHISGIPGDTFVKEYLKREDYNPLRVAKEFVKFNERSLVQLQGDMRNDNYVVEIVPDFDDLYFRLRAIDFDQFAYEGDVKIYMPQFFKENNPIINLGLKSMTTILELQYQREERTRLLTRVRAAGAHLANLLEALRKEELSTPENVKELRESLADLYQDDTFLLASTMGEILRNSLRMLEVYPMRKRKVAA
jgi:hypothetical protein